MVDKIEMSLDDIIKSTKGSRRGGVSNKGGAPRNNIRRGGGGGGGGGFRSSQTRSPGGVLKGRSRGGIQRTSNKYTRGDVNSAWKHDMFEGAKKNRLTAMGPAKLLVANLDFGVSESDINELFADFGPLKNASVHYDRSGRSLGTADVIFERRADAIKAMKQYNGVPLDGRPMSIQLATSEIPQPRPRTTAPPPRSPTRRPSSFGGGGRAPTNSRRGGGAGGGASARVGGGGRAGNRDRETKTAEELDAELDAYTKDMK